MSIDADVFRAILAMDVYNRGSSGAIKIDNAPIGKADLIKVYENTITGFVAQTYKWNGNIVISFRGTDTNGAWSFIQDVATGWKQGLGYQTLQAASAISTYADAAGSPQLQNIEFVGHSLGGGLAGYLGDLLGIKATVFNNMAFEMSANNFCLDALTSYPLFGNTGEYNVIYGDTLPSLPAHWENPTVLTYSVQGDPLAGNRGAQDSPKVILEQSSLEEFTDPHSQSLLTILLYGEKQETKSEWKPFRRFFLKHLFDASIAKETFATTIVSTGSVDEAMRQAIAYSAIDEGERPFGDNGIRALFDDAKDMGKVPGLGRIDRPRILDNSVESIAKAVVQFAGQIAINKSKVEDDPLARRGIIENVNSTIVVDLSENTWSKNAAGVKADIVSEVKLKQTYYNAMGSYTGLPVDVSLRMYELWSEKYPDIQSSPSNIIDRLVYQQERGAFTGIVAERVSKSDSDKVTLFAADGGPVNMIGHSGDDLLYGSLWDDTLEGRDGDDLLYGGSGNDKLKATKGINLLDGGDGDDLLVGGGGAAGNPTKLYGGAGDDTVYGYSEDGLVFADVKGEGTDYIYHGNNFIATAGTEDYLLNAWGIKMFGAIAHGDDVSDSNVAYDLNGAYRYMVNKENTLIIENVLGWQTQILNYEGGPGVSNPTAHITVEQMDWTAFKLNKFSETIDNNGIIKSVCEVMNANHLIMFGEPAGVTDPLVLDLDGDGIELEGHTIGVSPYFDLDEDNFAESTGWVGGGDGLLVHDINGDGKINDISELFGNTTTSGFDELSAFDSNGDQIIDASDIDFTSLQVWRDFNGNATTDDGELFSLSDLGIQSIDLNDTVPDAPGEKDPIASTGTFTWADGSTGEIADVNFTNNNFDTQYLGDSTVSAEAEALPDLKGWGVLTGLRIAMTNDANLFSAVQTASQAAPTTIDGIRQMIIPVLRSWAGNHDSGIGDLHYLYTTTEDASINVRDIAIYNPTTGVWSLQSGRAITDGNGDVIEDPTLADIQAMSFSWEGAAWAVFDSHDFDFLEQYFGDDLLITPETLTNPSAGTVIENYLTMLYDFQTSLGVAFAAQAGLSGFFEDIVYDVQEGLYSSTNEYQLTPLYKNILMASPQTDASVATAYLNGWEPILDVFQQRFTRSSAELSNTYSFLFSNLVGAYESVGHGVLSISEAASALTIPHIIEGTGELTGTSENDIYYMGPGDQVAMGGSGPDAYVFGSDFGQDVIDDSDGDDYDAIRFATYKSDEITASRDGSDLILTVTATGDSVRIVEQFARKRNGLVGGYIDPDRGVGEIVFADGVIWDILEMARQVIDPQDGDQVYTGTRSTDFLEGGAGNDTLSGKDSLDVYKFGIGSGNDVIQDQMEFMLFEDQDFIEFGEGISIDDLIFERDGNSDDLLIRINGTTDTITVKGMFDANNTGVFNLYWPDRIENLAFSDGSVMRWNEVMEHLVQKAKTDGNDEIFGFHYQDTLDGGLGDDTLRGGNDGDTYVFGRGYGQDVIDDGQNDILTPATDTVLFNADVLPEDVQLSRIGDSNDLIISIADDTATLTITDQFDATETGTLGTQWFNRIETFQFQDAAETVWTWEDIMQKMVADAKTDGDDVIYGFHYQDTLDGGAGNDTLMGGARSDVYKFGIGYGHDVIHDDIETILTDDNDRVEFGPGITLADLTVSSANEGNDLVITINSTGETLTIENQFSLTGVSSMDNRIEEFHFDDGTVMYSQDFGRLATTGTSGDDLIYGSNGYDTLVGGAGDDTLVGKSYSDVYVIDAGSGHDVIRETVTNIIHPDNDVVVFGEGITPDHIMASRSGNDLILTINETDSLTVENCFLSEFNEIEESHFEDGTIWTLDDVQTMTLVGTEGDDSLLGFDRRSDVLDGGLGNDTLKGAGAADTYVFDVGYGQDVIQENARILSDDIKDKVLFGEGITTDNINLSRSENDLVISVEGTTDQLTIDGIFFTKGYEVEEFHFADGTIWTLDDVQERLLLGTDGDDYLHGFDDRSDVLDGGLGNDTLKGEGYADTYVFDVGYGQDVIEDMAQILSADIKDKVVFGAGITTENIVLSRSGDDLIITIDGTTDQLTVKDTLDSDVYKVEEYHFADGTVWTLDDVVAILENTDPPLVPTHVGTAGDDTINGTSGDDIIQGGKGNDYITGGYGHDTYLFNLGDGQDDIYDNGLNGEVDTLVLGAGLTVEDVTVTHSTSDVDDVTLTFSSGDSILLNEQDYGYGKGIDRVEFADGTVWSKSDIARAYFAQANTSGDDYILGFDLLDDTIAGGLGNDSLRGGYGEDTYVFNLGDGQDDIYDNGLSGEVDTLALGAGLTVEDVTVTHSTSDVDDVTLTFSSGDSILLNEQDYGYGKGIDRVEFADGTVWSKSDIAQTYFAQANTSGDDYILGFDLLDDTIAGGLGNDSLRGGYGEDTYVFNLGDGQDDIYDNGLSGEVDTLVLGAGLTVEDVTITRSTSDADDVTLTFSSGDSILLNEQDASTSKGIDRIEFADGTTWNYAALQDAYFNQAATSADNYILGFSDADDFGGGAGHDTLAGGYGSDTYRFNLGDEYAMIYDYGSSSDTDVLVLGDGISTTDVAVTWDTTDADDIILQLTSGDTIYLNEQDYLSSYGIEQVVFEDGTIWSKSDLVSMANASLAPVVLDLDGDGVEFSSDKVTFDFDSDGVQEQGGWAAADDGFLVLDRNNDGVIASGDELSFVQDTPDGQTDLQGLQAYDTNSDGFLSAEDTDFDKFMVWSDKNQNGVSEAGELSSLADVGIASLCLTGTPTGASTLETPGATVLSMAEISWSDGGTTDAADTVLKFDQDIQVNHDTLLESQLQLFIDTFSSYTQSDPGMVALPDILEDDSPAMLVGNWKRS